MENDARAKAPRALMVAATVLIAFLAWTSVVGDRGLIAIRRLRTDEHRVRSKAEDLEAENAKLKDDIRRLTDDDVYLERVARESQGLVKDGEIIYRFPPSASERQASSQATATPGATPTP